MKNRPLYNKRNKWCVTKNRPDLFYCNICVSHATSSYKITSLSTLLVIFMRNRICTLMDRHNFSTKFLKFKLAAKLQEFTVFYFRMSVQRHHSEISIYCSTDSRVLSLSTAVMRSVKWRILLRKFSTYINTHTSLYYMVTQKIMPLATMSQQTVLLSSCL